MRFKLIKDQSYWWSWFPRLKFIIGWDAPLNSIREYIFDLLWLLRIVASDGRQYLDGWRGMILYFGRGYSAEIRWYSCPKISESQIKDKEVGE